MLRPKMSKDYFKNITPSPSNLTKIVFLIGVKINWRACSKANGFHTSLPRDLREVETFDALSRSMIQSIGHIGQTYLRYERNLLKADANIDELIRENVDFEKKASDAEKALQKAQEDLKTFRSEEKSTSDRLFHENSRLSSELEEAKRKIRDLIEERDLNPAIVESKVTGSFEEGRKNGRNEVLKVCEKKLERARYYMEGFIETFKVTSLFGQARAVAETLRSLFGKGHILSEDVIKKAEEKSHQLSEQAGAAVVPELKEEDFNLSKDLRLSDN